MKITVSESIRKKILKQSQGKGKLARFLLAACATLIALGGEVPSLRQAQATPAQAQQRTVRASDPFAAEPTNYPPLGYDPFNDDLLAATKRRLSTANATNNEPSVRTIGQEQEKDIVATPQKPSAEGGQTKAQEIENEANSQSPVVQANQLTDIQNSWAQPFIAILADRGIIAGFPDGTFRPNAPVTRAQYAAIIQQAFNEPAVRTGLNFVDVPANYWATDAIDYAYRSGFLAGYPNRIFQPDQSIPRVQALVSLASGLSLATAPTVDLSEFYTDAEQIPNYALSGIRAATSEELVVNYPNVSFLNPNQLATRADVAAFIYQALVEAGQLSPLAPTVAATDYIVGYETEMAMEPEPAPAPTLTPEQARERLRVPDPDLEEILVASQENGVPAVAIGVPTGFGADDGVAFIGLGYQNQTRPRNVTPRQVEDGGFIVGFGLGDAQENVGFQVGVASYSLFRDDSVPFETGGVSLKLHRQINRATSVAVGVDNIVKWGNSDSFTSYYGAATRIFTRSRDPEDFLSSIAVTVGVGNGRFRTIDDINNDDETVNVFGSVGLRLAEPVSLVGAYTGQTITLGVSYAPFRNIPFVITPAVTDLINVDHDPRFTITAGYGFRLF